ncbi:hypothetical protein ThvES_00018260 [Thiovulum sp. ES]|nr:hypothetical protein ThvES_00018260 [Thiovulum sp. ES]
MKKIALLTISFLPLTFFSSCETANANPNVNQCMIQDLKILELEKENRSCQNEKNSLQSQIQVQKNAPKNEQDVFEYVGSNNEKATKKLFNFLKNRGFEVEKLDDVNFFLISYNEYTFFLEVLATEGLDRILVTKVFKAEKDVKKDDLIVLSMLLNNSFNVGIFNADEGVMILYRTMSFVDKFDLIEFKEFLKYQNSIDKAIISNEKTKDLALKLLK